MIEGQGQRQDAMQWRYHRRRPGPAARRIRPTPRMVTCGGITISDAWRPGDRSKIRQRDGRTAQVGRRQAPRLHATLERIDLPAPALRGFARHIPQHRNEETVRHCRSQARDRWWSFPAMTLMRHRSWHSGQARPCSPRSAPGPAGRSGLRLAAKSQCRLRPERFACTTSRHARAMLAAMVRRAPRNGASA